MINGKYIAIPTFYKDNKIDCESIHRHILNLEAYYDNIIVFGSTGDQAYLKLEEKILIINFLSTKNYITNLVWGVTSTRLDEVKTLVKHINLSKYQDILLMNLLYLKFNQIELITYVSDIRNLSSGYIMLYNNPMRSNNKFEVDTINELLKLNLIDCLKDVSNNDPKLINSKFVYTGFDQDLIDKRYYSVTTVIGNILPRFVSFLMDDRVGINQDFIFLLSELIEVGIVKSIKYILFINGTSTTYDMAPGYMKLKENEINRLDELNYIIEKLNNIGMRNK